MNYTTKRGYRIALKLNTQQMNLDMELEREGYTSKMRAKFFNRIWHPYLPRKVSAMQWLVLSEGLPVGAWREKIGLPNTCELCPNPVKETLQHALQDCPQLSRAWDLFRNTRRAAHLPPSYFTWADISRGLMRDPPGPKIEEDLRWDTASAFSLNTDTPWDILRAQLLWSIWCQKVAHTFRDEKFHLGVVLWHAWRNTIYCAMEAYKELFRHKRNEVKRQEVISCFQQIWTAENLFGRLQRDTIKWNITPPQEFLPRELGAWTVPPIRINRLSPSPDIEAEFAARPDFANLVDEFLQNVGDSWQPPRTTTSEEAECSNAHHEDSNEASVQQEDLNDVSILSGNVGEAPSISGMRAKELMTTTSQVPIKISSKTSALLKNPVCESAQDKKQIGPNEARNYSDEEVLGFTEEGERGTSVNLSLENRFLFDGRSKGHCSKRFQIADNWLSCLQRHTCNWNNAHQQDFLCRDFEERSALNHVNRTFLRSSLFKVESTARLAWNVSKLSTTVEEKLDCGDTQVTPNFQDSVNFLEKPDQQEDFKDYSQSNEEDVVSSVSLDGHIIQIAKPTENPKEVVERGKGTLDDLRWKKGLLLAADQKEGVTSDVIIRPSNLGRPFFSQLRKKTLSQRLESKLFHSQRRMLYTETNLSQLRSPT